MGKGHKDAVHEGKKPFKCSLCDGDFSKSGDLKRHVETVHEGKKPYKCPNCDTRFPTKGNMKTHIEKIHFPGQNVKITFLDHGEKMKVKQEFDKNEFDILPIE